MPLASAPVMTLTAFALDMSYGHFVESRTKRELAKLFGTYVPPEMVDEMVKDPDRHSMMAISKEHRVKGLPEIGMGLNIDLQRESGKKYLYRLYAKRVASMRLLPFDPAWDGATNFETK